MIRTFLGTLTLSFLVTLILLCHSCAPAGRPVTDIAAEKKPAPETSEQAPKIVARVGDYVITADELAKNTLIEALPHEWDESEGYSRKNDPVDVRTNLMRMVGDKIMIIKGRDENILENDQETKMLLEKYIEEITVRLFLTTYLKGKINITESEIDDKMKNDTRLKSRAQARAVLEGQKSNELINELYEELHEELEVQELRDNVSKAARIYKRLLDDSRRFGGRNFVRVKQIKEDLTTEERNLPLATFDGGELTFKYWLFALTDLSPPARPGDLDTDVGVSRFLNRILANPLFLAEAKRQGLDKDETLVKRIREREDMYLLNRVKRKKTTGILKHPGTERIVEYFKAHQKRYSTSDWLKIKQIWCPDLETAWKVKLELDGGADFDSVGKKYAIDNSAHSDDVYPGGEGMFFADLWKGKTTEIMEPVKGFYGDQVKWRVVKILEKHEEPLSEYSESIRKHVQNDMWFSKRDEILDRYRLELMKLYPYEIYPENVIDPFDIP